MLENTRCHTDITELELMLLSLDLNKPLTQRNLHIMKILILQLVEENIYGPIFT